MRAAIATLESTWTEAWPEAVARWSRYARLSRPLLCSTSEAAREGLTESFAMIRLDDKRVVIDLERIRALGLGDFAPEILSHEVGHHILAPATVTDHGRLLARTRHGLPGAESMAPMVANIYADMLINDRLQRSHRLRMDEVHRAVLDASKPSKSALWHVIHRSYEILWSLRSGTLAPKELDARTEGDAELCARLIRVYGREWLDGGGRFAALVLPYVAADERSFKRSARRWFDMEQASLGARPPAGLSTIDDGESAGAVHPSADPRLNGARFDESADAQDSAPQPTSQGGSGSPGQARTPFEFGQLFRALGLDLSDHEAAMLWYREQAAPHIVPFPSWDVPQPTDELPEGFEPWENGEDFSTIDWPHSIFKSPVVIPGATTVKRVYGLSEEPTPRREPLHLDIYVDSSGSMPSPQLSVSYPALAGAVLVLSALRAGARVQATLWSGPGQFETTGGFTEDGDEILRVITGHIGGSTQFPLHVLRDTYLDDSSSSADRAPRASFRFTGDESSSSHLPRPWEGHPTHLVVISDDGVDTMLMPDERGTPGGLIASEALAAAGGGGTLVLDQTYTLGLDDRLADLGWVIEPVADMAGLVEAARRFAHRTFGSS